MHRVTAFAAFALLVLGACDDRRDARPTPFAPAAGMLEGNPLAVDGSGSAFTRLHLVIEGSGLERPLEIEFEAGEGEAVVGAIDLYPGGYGVIARGYDREGNLTHEGKGKLRVLDGFTPQLELAMPPQPGSQWGWVRIGSHRLTVSQHIVRLGQDEDVKLEFGMVDATGRELPIKEGSLAFDFPGWPNEPPRLDVVYGGYKAWIAWQQMNGGLRQVRVCGGRVTCLVIPVVDTTAPKVVTAGAHTSCVLRKTGAATCWGVNHNGESGEASGVSHLGGHVFDDITAGPRNHAQGSHVCAVDRQGAVWCWGRNTSGQLGNGLTGLDTDKQPVPQHVALPLAARSVAPGARHTCALLIDGTVHCWGEAKFGQMGDGSYRTNTSGPANRTSPAPVPTALRFTSLGSGVAHSCGLTLAGEVYCWGRNVEMQTGVDTASAPSVACNYQGLGAIWDQCVAVPTRVQNAPVLAKLAVGGFDSCGITAAGEGWCWGGSWQGAPKPGDPANWSFPTHVPQLVLGGITWSHLSVGGGFKCGFDTSDEGACWGQDHYGTHGDGTSGGAKISPSARSVVGQHLFVSMDAGDDHACGIRRSDSQVMCWGYQLGGSLGYHLPPGNNVSASPQLVTVLY